MIEEQKQEESQQVVEQEVSTRTGAPKPWLWVAAILLFCATAFSLIELTRERRAARQLAASNTDLSSMLGQTRSQVEALTAKLNSLTSKTEAKQPSAAKASRAPASQRASAGAGKTPRVAEDARWNQIQAELAEHKKEIEAAQQDIAKTRFDLEGNLKFAKDELGGQIARNHDELVALQKRGERNYYEFDLTKSKQFKRVGSISLSLHKADPKHDQFDMVLLVDDYNLTKKHVSLYEPVLLYPADSELPLELVVNRIEKNQVRGYVSEPKYRKAELAASAPSASESSSPSDAQAGLPHRPGTER